MTTGQTSIQTQSGYLMWLNQYLSGAGFDTEQIKAIMDAEYKRMNQGMPPDASPYYRDVYQFYINYQREVAPEPTIGGYEVETQGGYNFAVVRDETGNIIDLRSLGVAEAEGLSAWQQSQISQWQQEFQLQQEQAQWQQQQAGLQQQQAMMPYGQMTAYQKAQMELQQQAQWAETMSMPPSGWIEQFYRMQGLQPQVGYRPEKKRERMTEEEYSRRFREAIPMAREAIYRWETGGGALPSVHDMPLRGNWVFIDENTPTRGLITHTIEEPGLISTPYGMGKPGVGLLPDYAPREAGIGYQTIAPPPKPPAEKKPSTGLWQPVQRPMATAGKRPTTPPAPPGLSQFVPSQRTGQPITRAPTTTPSGQMWGQTPWSTQEMLRGYTGWAGYRPYEDIMQHMWAMQPQTPAGAGQKRWQPAKQWA